MTDRPDDPASARVAPVTHHRATAIDGVSIFYREAGPADAPVVLLLHGFPTWPLGIARQKSAARLVFAAKGGRPRCWA
jgi:pimeloyl-ACP methyl ester carboxylesterase